ncbi:hypothetical protein AVEN_175375-1 [Araneus ventricosus]|uniref:Uncharacterized protein n=1 Tax=Araneus ventricosus TaxID=182803 RepID=A0A4Y2JIS1_ARAVE|nr:hypothetical protein AVEN_175375-1 [Araneus ventricosus]
MGHRESIRRKRPGMLSDGVIQGYLRIVRKDLLRIAFMDVILLNGNTHTARKTQELLQKFKWQVWIHFLVELRFGTNLGLIDLSRARFSSNSDVKSLA